MNKTPRKNPFRYLPMDGAHMIFLSLLPIFRNKCFHVSGKRTKTNIKGGAVIAANHTGFIDPFVLGTVFWRRRMFLLTAKEVMATPTREFLLIKAGCIRIDRSISDMTAIRNCVTVLKEGKLLGIFPEGHIQRQGQMDAVKSGAVLIALQAGVPIVPLYSQKPKKWWHRRRVVLGDSLDLNNVCQKRFPSIADIEQLSKLLQTKMEECKQTYEQLERSTKRD